ncbi:unnamed protein product [Amoebophrya sp. A120]|nr:unnamed protein product [Amoebophrya sp. A120]|eukprot:GSA120T00014116001.1
MPQLLLPGGCTTAASLPPDQDLLKVSVEREFQAFYGFQTTSDADRELLFFEEKLAIQVETPLVLVSHIGFGGLVVFEAKQNYSGVSEHSPTNSAAGPRAGVVTAVQARVVWEVRWSGFPGLTPELFLRAGLNRKPLPRVLTTVLAYLYELPNAVPLDDTIISAVGLEDAGNIKSDLLPKLSLPMKVGSTANASSSDPTPRRLISPGKQHQGRTTPTSSSRNNRNRLSPRTAAAAPSPGAGGTTPIRGGRLGAVTPPRGQQLPGNSFHHDRQQHQSGAGVLSPNSTANQQLSTTSSLRAAARANKERILANAGPGGVMVAAAGTPDGNKILNGEDGSTSTALLRNVEHGQNSPSKTDRTSGPPVAYVKAEPAKVVDLSVRLEQRLGSIFIASQPITTTYQNNETSVKKTSVPPRSQTKGRFYLYYLAIAFCGLFVRCQIAQNPHSGEGQYPKFGDFEAQRHWVEITNHIPMSDWYFGDYKYNELDYWGLDYPPLTMYHAWLIGKFYYLLKSVRFSNWLLEFFSENTLEMQNAASSSGRSFYGGSSSAPSGAVAEDWFARYHSRGNEDCKIFMRFMVLLTDFLIFGTACYYYCEKVLKNETLLFGGAVGSSGNKSTSNNVLSKFRLLFFAFLYNSPSIIFIDHGHFQFNTIALGLVLWAVNLIYFGRKLAGSVLFVLALFYKQTMLYFAPAFFFYLLGEACSGLGSTTSSAGNDYRPSSASARDEQGVDIGTAVKTEKLICHADRHADLGFGSQKVLSASPSSSTRNEQKKTTIHEFIGEDVEESNLRSTVNEDHVEDELVETDADGTRKKATLIVRSWQKNSTTTATTMKNNSPKNTATKTTKPSTSTTTLKTVLFSFTFYKNLFQLGVTVLLTCLALLLPFLIQQDNGGLQQLAQIKNRVFPFGRGIFEDYVSNLWVLLSPVLKLRELTRDEESIYAKASSIGGATSSLFGRGPSGADFTYADASGILSVSVSKFLHGVLLLFETTKLLFFAIFHFLYGTLYRKVFLDQYLPDIQTCYYQAVAQSARVSSSWFGSGKTVSENVLLNALGSLIPDEYEPFLFDLPYCTVTKGIEAVNDCLQEVVVFTEREAMPIVEPVLVRLLPENLINPLKSTSTSLFETFFSNKRQVIFLLSLTLTLSGAFGGSFVTTFYSKKHGFGAKSNLRQFLKALTISSLSFFLFSWQVHEKAVLLPLLPVLLALPFVFEKRIIDAICDAEAATSGIIASDTHDHTTSVPSPTDSAKSLVSNRCKNSRNAVFKTFGFILFAHLSLLPLSYKDLNALAWLQLLLLLAAMLYCGFGILLHPPRQALHDCSAQTKTSSQKYSVANLLWPVFTITLALLNFLLIAVEAVYRSGIVPELLSGVSLSSLFGSTLTSIDGTILGFDLANYTLEKLITPPEKYPHLYSFLNCSLSAVFFLVFWLDFMRTNCFCFCRPEKFFFCFGCCFLCRKRKNKMGINKQQGYINLAGERTRTIEDAMKKAKTPIPSDDVALVNLLQRNLYLVGED